MRIRETDGDGTNSPLVRGIAPILHSFGNVKALRRPGIFPATLAVRTQPKVFLVHTFHNFSDQAHVHHDAALAEKLHKRRHLRVHLERQVAHLKICKKLDVVEHQDGVEVRE